MAGNKLTINLTPDQQKQIKDATGKSITELTVNLPDSQLPDRSLEQVAGGGSLLGGVDGINLSGLVSSVEDALGISGGSSSGGSGTTSTGGGGGNTSGTRVLNN